MTKKILQNDWNEILQDQFEQPYYLKIREYLKEAYGSRTIYPDMHDIYNALHYTAFSDVKVVILGQDPYHGPGQAHGLSFSVRPNVRKPPSLQNIFKELNSDLGHPIPNHGYLKDWAEQGVLLLNTTLTVEAGKAASHSRIGWSIFTDRVISSLNEKTTPVIFILWGRHAQSKRALINTNFHHIIESVHPSPLSVHGGFYGSKPFSKANELLIQSEQRPINWEIAELN